MVNFHVKFGGTADSIYRQLKSQRIHLGRKEATIFQRLADAILLLSVHGIIAGQQVRSAEGKLVDMLQALLEELEGENHAGDKG